MNLYPSCLSVLVASLVIAAPALAQSGTGGLEVAPGLRVTGDAIVWALESPDAKPALHPLARNNATITSPTKANPKPHDASIIHGARAAVRIHAGPAAFYVAYSKGEDEENHKPSPSAPLVFAIVRLHPAQNKRVVAWYDYSTSTQKPDHRETVVESTSSPSADFAWLKITPTQPLTPGEYAIVQLMPAYKTLSTWIFDFGVD